MLVLGVISTGAIAASAEATNADAAATTVDTAKAAAADATFWKSIIDRNIDSNGFNNAAANDKLSLSGLVKVRAESGVNRHNTDLRKITLEESAEELYVDAPVNEYTTAHMALSRGWNSTINNLNGEKYTVSGSDQEKDKTLYISEAYVKMNYNNFFAKVGQQALNFGSTSHHSISTPLTQTLSNTNQLAITVGMQNLKGFYADGSMYKGAATTTVDHDTKKDVIGYTIDLGYAIYNDKYSSNVYVDYISNMADVNEINFDLAKLLKDAGRTATYKKTPGVALHGDVTMGPWSLLADYVVSAKKFDKGDSEYNGEAARPQAYNIEARGDFFLFL